ncbi:MAG: hypothetical protein Q9188_003897 [Gyalolechia gomerana]
MTSQSSSTNTDTVVLSDEENNAIFYQAVQSLPKVSMYRLHALIRWAFIRKSNVRSKEMRDLQPTMHRSADGENHIILKGAPKAGDSSDIPSSRDVEARLKPIIAELVVERIEERSGANTAKETEDAAGGKHRTEVEDR